MGLPDPLNTRPSMSSDTGVRSTCVAVRAPARRGTRHRGGDLRERERHRRLPWRRPRRTSPVNSSVVAVLSMPDVPSNTCATRAGDAAEVNARRRGSAQRAAGGATASRQRCDIAPLARAHCHSRDPTQALRGSWWRSQAGGEGRCSCRHPPPARTRAAGRLRACTTARSPSTSSTCPLRVVPSPSRRFTISAYFARCGRGVGRRARTPFAGGKPSAAPRRVPRVGRPIDGGVPRAARLHFVQHHQRAAHARDGAVLCAAPRGAARQAAAATATRR